MSEQRATRAMITEKAIQLPWVFLARQEVSKAQNIGPLLMRQVRWSEHHKSEQYNQRLVVLVTHGANICWFLSAPEHTSRNREQVGTIQPLPNGMLHTMCVQ